MGEESDAHPVILSKKGSFICKAFRTQFMDFYFTFCLQETYGGCMSGIYGDVTQFSNDECSWLLQEMYRLEEEADKKPKKWEHHWNTLKHPTRNRMVSLQG